MDKLVFGIGVILVIVAIGLSSYSVTSTATVRNPAYCGSYGCGPAYYSATATAQPYLGVGLILFFVAFVVMVIGA